MKDLVLGSFTGYDYAQLQYWVNSLKQSGFNGDIVVVVGNASFATVEKLVQKGIKCICFEKDDENHKFHYNSSLPIQTERFFHFWNFLKDRWKDYRYVITTDMKDVIFQTDPSEWLDKNTLLDDLNVDIRILATTECLTYENEPWGRQNLEQTFGSYFYETFKHWEIYNVGVIVGNSWWMKDLCLQIFQTAINRPIAICEQACYNYIIQGTCVSEHTERLEMNEGFVVHLGTVMDPTKIEQFRPHLLEAEPYFDGGVVFPNNEQHRFCMVHQYDRVPELKQIIEKKYGD